MNLRTPLKQASRIHKLYASRLEKLNIRTLEDFLYHIPSRYEDYSKIYKIAQATPGEIATIQGYVVSSKNQYLRSSRTKTIQKIILSDDTGQIELTWFNQPYITKSLSPNVQISISGKIESNPPKLSMNSPDFEILNENTTPLHTGRLIPIYPETRGISSKWLRRQIHNLLNQTEQTEYLPKELIATYKLPLLQQALKQIHFPTNLHLASSAKYRLSFDELLLLRLHSLKRHAIWQKNKKSHALNINKHQSAIDKLINSLPFTLTNSQKKATEEILKDLTLNQSMNRLLQGDVGSGKTIVASIAIYLTYLNKYQSILLAPTEILADQHFTTLTKFLSPLGVKIGLITGNKKTHTKTQNIDILVGTHALLNNKIKLDKLALVIIDEQQRFGVEQRSAIREKGRDTHLLTMTATPIPRTTSLILSGELNLSFLNEMPGGRKRIKTWVVPKEKREKAYQWIKNQLKEHKTQAFIICPFIEPSENMQTVKAAANEYEHLQKNIFTEFKVALLHGKLKPKEKEKVMQDFKDKKYDILVATPVVEVGIDIPDASIILIEGSERFGLAQLHQLRGRVGRRDQQAYCLLFTESSNPTTKNRLKFLETIYAGAELAEMDLHLRGPGDLYGTAQHGIQPLKIASYSDTSLLETINQAAIKIYPELDKFPLLKQKVEQLINKNISPD